MISSINFFHSFPLYNFNFSYLQFRLIFSFLPFSSWPSLLYFKLHSFYVAISFSLLFVLLFSFLFYITFTFLHSFIPFYFFLYPIVSDAFINNSILIFLNILFMKQFFTIFFYMSTFVLRNLNHLWLVLLLMI